MSQLHNLFHNLLCLPMQLRWAARLRTLLVFGLMLTASTVAQAGLLVVGLDSKTSEWKLFVQPDGQKWQVIDTEDEPRTPVYLNQAKGVVFYADSEGNIRSRSDEDETIIFKSSDAYSLTQPVLSSDAKYIYMVALKNGASLDTDILRGEIATGEIKSAVIQRSAQFEPFALGDVLYYSSVSCVPPSCHRIIEDIWQMNPVSREAMQLTLANAISREPIVDANTGQLFFISDKTGRFRLHTLEGRESIALTRGEGSDSSPAITSDGDVVFIERQRGQPDTLKMWSKTSSDLQEIAVPVGVDRLRDLSTW